MPPAKRVREPSAGTLSGVSTANRAYNLLRGYVGREWDRLTSAEASSAEAELYQAVNSVALYEGASQPVAEPAAIDHTAYARQVLGVSPEADFGEVRKAYERLSKRSDPDKFPEGTAEREEASKIHALVSKAYRILSSEVDDTEKRFRTLEI